MARTLKQTKTKVGTTSSSVWTWRQVVKEYFNDDYITTNKSIVVVESQLGRPSGQSSQSFGGTATTKITQDDDKREKSQTWNYGANYISGGGWFTIQTEEFEVEHESDGTKKITVSSSLSTTAFNPNSASASEEIELTTIPRASKITCPSFNIGDSTVINIERYSSEFKDTITWNFGSLSGTLATLTTSLSVGFTPVKADFYKQIPSARSGKGTITCNTYKGNTLIGTSTCEFTAYAVEEKPTITTTIVDTNSTTIALTGNSSKIIKYMSKPKITINATAKNSATIKSYSLLTGDGQSSTTKETTLSNGIGSNKYTAGATDSRDYTQSSEITISNFVDYVKCSFTKKNIYRTESASKEIKCDLAGNYYNGSFGSVSNSITLKYRTRIKNGTWSSYTTVSATLSGNTWKYSASLGTTFEINTEYEVEFSIADKLTSDKISQVIEKGIGVVEIGEDLVNVNGDLTVNDVNILDLIYPVGSIYLAVNSVSPQTLYGGTWERIKDTFLLSAGDTYSAGSTGGEAKHTLTVSELPSHQHSLHNNNSGGTTADYSSYGVTAASNVGYSGNIRTTNTGSGEAHNNMPPYLAVYVWKRTK